MVVGRFIGKAMIDRAKAGKLPKSTKAVAVVKAEARDARVVPHLGITEVRQVADAAAAGRQGPRDRLLIQTLFDGCLRISEGLAIRPADIKQDENGWFVAIVGKGGRYRLAAISPSLAAGLNSYAYLNEIARDALLFPVSRRRAHQVIEKAMIAAGVEKPARVGYCHVLRHSGAIERLKITGNPKALQDQLGHSMAVMTLRYMKTITALESLTIQQGVNHSW